jgi:multidrug efflux pump subunit AcrA (membrane-fusion protein)
MVDDVTLRLFPSIAQLAGIAELEAAVGAISQAVQRADAEDLERNVRRAADALGLVRAQATDAEAADLSAIDLAIDGSTRLLRYPAQAAGRANHLRDR